MPCTHRVNLRISIDLEVLNSVDHIITTSASDDNTNECVSVSLALVVMSETRVCYIHTRIKYITPIEWTSLTYTHVSNASHQSNTHCGHKAIGVHTRVSNAHTPIRYTQICLIFDS